MQMSKPISANKLVNENISRREKELAESFETEFDKLIANLGLEHIQTEVDFGQSANDPTMYRVKLTGYFVDTPKSDPNQTELPLGPVRPHAHMDEFGNWQTCGMGNKCLSWPRKS